MAQENLDIMGKMGERVARAGLPAAIRGGFDVTPNELSKCDFAQKMFGVMVATEGGTARSGPGEESRVDYSVADVHMAKATLLKRSDAGKKLPTARTDWRRCTSPSGRRI